MKLSTPARTEPDANPAPPRLRRRRSPRLLVLGVLLAIVGALLGWFAYQQATQHITVVALARPVAFGQVISNLDVRPVPLPSGSDLSSIAWSDVDTVVGRTAATQLYAGQTLPPEALRAEPIPAAGDAVIGIAAGPGQLPTTPLAARDEVLVVRLDEPAAMVRAVVLAVGAPDVSGRRTIDLLVPEELVPGLARAAGDDRTVLVLAGRR
jgi:flagella basal body P-ring formation protein FlgA